MTPEQMDQAMKDSITAFPAKTEGLGAQVLAPTVLADGTKQFDLTTSMTQWQVSPGKTVEAMTYNGTVPGPTIKVDPGDNVRIVLHNEMPQSTSIHFHGLITPNSMDGTTYVTQEPVKTGETLHLRVDGAGHAGGRDVPLAPQRGGADPDGLAGAFIVGEQPVPAGVTVSQEQVMILDDSGVIGYALNGKSFPATTPIVAKQGEWIELHYMNEGSQIHPMHLHGMPQLVIAKDGMPARPTRRTRTRSRSLPASATRCSSTPPSSAPGCGTATSSPTPRTSTACSAWSPRWSCSERAAKFVLLFPARRPCSFAPVCQVDLMTIYVG